MRLRRPVFDGDVVRCTPEPDTATADELAAVVVRALTGEPEQPRAVFRAVRRVGAPPAMRDGERLRSISVPLTGELGSDYGSRAGDELEIFAELGLVHPAVWPAVANHVVHVQVARGSWIHTRSIVRHHGLALAATTADVHATVVRRFESRGERAVLDVRIEVDGLVLATLEHEAIVALTPE